MNQESRKVARDLGARRPGIPKVITPLPGDVDSEFIFFPVSLLS
jgi:hypothetical protein